MNSKEYLTFAKKELNDLLVLIEKKNSDYTGGSQDALANFKLCEEIGLGKAEHGVLIRMMDKVQRIKSFLAKGSLEVANESAQDAARDIIGYSLALLAMLEDKANQKRTEPVQYKIPISGSLSDTTESITRQRIDAEAMCMKEIYGG